MSKLKLTVLKYADTFLSESACFVGGSPDKMLPITLTFHLIETDGLRILADTGCNELPGFEMTRFCRPSDVLAECGLAPDDITDVLISHAHHDHIGRAADFPRARFHVQKLEYASGRSYFPEGAEILTFEEEHPITESIRMLRIGGHAPGSCITTFPCGGKTCVLGGDECYLDACLERGIPTGSSCSPEKSRAFIEKYRAPEFRVFLCHDPSILPGRLGHEVLIDTTEA